MESEWNRGSLSDEEEVDKNLKSHRDMVDFFHIKKDKYIKPKHSKRYTQEIIPYSLNYVTHKWALIHQLTL